MEEETGGREKRMKISGRGGRYEERRNGIGGRSRRGEEGGREGRIGREGKREPKG